MRSLIKLVFLSVLLTAAMSAPQKDRQDRPDESPLAALGNFIQRLQTNFAEGSAAVGQPQGNAYSLSLSAPKPTIPTTPSTTLPPTTTRKPVKTAFDSINAILDNIRNNSPNSNRIDDDDDDNRGNKNNGIFGSVPGRSLNFPPRTPPPNFFQPTPKPPFSIDGISQGINAFFQTFLKTNLDKIFKPPQDHQKRDIEPRIDEPNRVPSLIDIIVNGLFRRPN